MPVVATSGRGAVLNYALYGSVNGTGSPNLTANLDAARVLDAGLFSQSALLHTGGTTPGQSASTPASAAPIRRRCIHGRPATSSPAASPGRGRFASPGWQLARNFSLRPDLVTMRFPASRAAPPFPPPSTSTPNDARIFSSPVARRAIFDRGPAGRHRRRHRTSGGYRRHRRQTATELPFFASSMLLRPGLTDFSVEAGLPRRSYGILSADYAATQSYPPACATA